MEWLTLYQLFLFDFDGVLVDTEHGHYDAYKRMCAARGFTLNWTFEQYSKIAHYTSNGMPPALFKEFPDLYKQEPNWPILYSEKTRALKQLYLEGAIKLMPGVETFLKMLNDAGLARCVVTHSAKEIVTILRDQYPILNTIPTWITRENYTKPKPDPECYRIAVDRHLPKGGKSIGFEDSIRGLMALLGCGAKPVLVTQSDYPEIAELVHLGVVHLHSLEEINNIQAYV